MKILSIILIVIASLGVVAELKSEKAAIESISRYSVIAIFYIWAYLAQSYSDKGYKGGIKSILGVFLFGFGIIGLTTSIFSEVSKFSFFEYSFIVITLLAIIFPIAILLIVYGHKQHRKLVGGESNT